MEPVVSSVEPCSRRRFFRGLTVAGAAVALLSWYRKPAVQTPSKVRLLTHDGQLVEVDRSRLRKKKVALKDQVLGWVWKFKS